MHHDLILFYPDVFSDVRRNVLQGLIFIGNFAENLNPSFPS